MSEEASQSNIVPVETTGEAGVARCNAVFRNAEAGRCVSGVVHDLNNYLGAIMAYADLVELEEGLADEPRRMLGEIHSAVGRCSELLNFLTALTRTNKANYNMADPVDIVKRVIALRRHRHNVSETTTTVIAPDTLPAVVLDLPAMQFALLCLVMNAEENIAELGPSSATPRKIVLKVERSEDGTTLWKVRDSGPELDPSQVELAFKPFTSRHKEEHFGLGLSTVQEIAKAHNGTLSYVQGEGFTLALPADTGHQL